MIAASGGSHRRGASPTPGGPSGVPGEMIGLPEVVSGGWADTSKNLTALAGYLGSLIERLAQNTRLSQVLLGAISPDQVPSGYALQLGFAPAQSLVRDAGGASP